MQTYILHGGETSRPSEDNKNFFKEMTKIESDEVKILCVYYSREESDWERLFKQDNERFKNAAPKENLILSVADIDPDKFKQQIKENDVIYMRGGDVRMLINKLKTIENFKELIKDKKILSGSSAGACAISKYYQTGTVGRPGGQGLNILDIKVFVHYSDDKKEELKKLEELEEELPIYKVEEEKFVVINK